MNIMTQHDKISAFIDNELTHEAEQDFLISLASNDGVRKAFRSELVLKNVIHQDELVTVPNRDMRGAILATIGIGAATAVATQTADAAVAAKASATGLKALFATKLNAILTAGLITASAAGGYVASTAINSTKATDVKPQVTHERVIQSPEVTAPENTAAPAVEMTTQQDVKKQAVKTKAPLKTPARTNTDPMGSSSGVGGSSLEMNIDKPSHK
jgi:negative regulator of sigma E activity